MGEIRNLRHNQCDLEECSHDLKGVIHLINSEGQRRNSDTTCLWQRWSQVWEECWIFSSSSTLYTNHAHAHRGEQEPKCYSKGKNVFVPLFFFPELFITPAITIIYHMPLLYIYCYILPLHHPRQIFFIYVPFYLDQFALVCSKIHRESPSLHLHKSFEFN